MYQKGYIEDLLKKYETHLSKYTPTFIKPNESDELKSISIDATKYRSLVGNLLYLVVSTRPDIIFAVTKSSRGSKTPIKKTGLI